MKGGKGVTGHCAPRPHNRHGVVVPKVGVPAVGAVGEAQLRSAARAARHHLAAPPVRLPRRRHRRRSSHFVWSAQRRKDLRRWPQRHSVVALLLGIQRGGSIYK
eukprot:83720-Chlamydomonas_euryale.AAC.1